jgi:hypothetical protein
MMKLTGIENLGLNLFKEKLCWNFSRNKNDLKDL